VANSAKHLKYHNAFIGSVGVSEEIHEHALSKLGHGGSGNWLTEARLHVPGSISSSDTRRDSSSRSTRFHSKNRCQFAVSEPTRLSVPFEVMSKRAEPEPRRYFHFVVC
jgi:hypothetical protein